MGGINTLNVASNSTKEHPYIIEGCINAGTIDYSKMTFKTRRTGGILGSGWCGGGANAGTLYIKDCLSLDVAQTKYVGTNEFRCDAKSVTSLGLPSTQVVKDSEGNGTVGTKTLAEIAHGEIQLRSSLLDSLTDLFCGECNWFIHRFTPPLTSL
jgi:hypothetical protein